METIKKHKKIGLSLLAVGVFVLLLNTGLQFYLEGKFLPGVSLGGHKLGGVSLAEAREMLQVDNNQIELTLKIGDKQYQFDTEELGATLDLETSLNLAYQYGRHTQFALLNLSNILVDQDRSDYNFSYYFDQDKFDQVTNKIIAESAEKPQNAQIVTNEGQIQITDDKPGKLVDVEDLKHQIIAALNTDQQDLVVEVDPVETDAKIQSKDLITVKNRIIELLDGEVSIDVGSNYFTVDPVTKASWININNPGLEDYNAELDSVGYSLNRDQIASWVAGVATQVDLPVQDKQITAAGGVTNVIAEGQNGKSIDQVKLTDSVYGQLENSQDRVIASASMIEVPFQIVYNQVAGIKSGTFIEISLDQQHLWVYENGNMIYDSPVTSGAAGAGFPTNRGLFSIYYKTTNTRLSGAPYGWDYDVPVDYWMPFDGGIGLHDAEWRTQFGGPDYYYGGSHGCVNLPDDTAAFIYNWSSVGTQVWVR